MITGPELHMNMYMHAFFSCIFCCLLWWGHQWWICLFVISHKKGISSFAWEKKTCWYQLLKPSSKMEGISLWFTFSLLSWPYAVHTEMEPSRHHLLVFATGSFPILLPLAGKIFFFSFFFSLYLLFSLNFVLQVIEGSLRFCRWWDV